MLQSLLLHLLLVLPAPALGRMPNSLNADGSLPGYCKLPELDRAGFEAAYCELDSWRTASGVQLMRGVAPQAELQLMRDHANRIPFPTRTLCGSSNEHIATPDICRLPEDLIRERFPRTLRGLNLGLGEFARHGREDGTLRIHGGHEIIRVSKEGMEDTRDEEHPWFYNGEHLWHTDGGGGEERGGIAGQLWLLVDKNATSVEQGRTETNLKVVPTDAFEAYVEPMDERCHYVGAILQALSCTVQMDPGDALFYKGSVFHSTQDTKNDREAFSFDVSREWSRDDEL
jgi:hypothetical protein